MLRLCEIALQLCETMGLASKCSTLLLRVMVMSRPGGVKMNEANETGPGGNGGSEGGGQEGESR